jgi:hypothetical protein
MVLWNRGNRGIVILLAFLLICISISLLLVTLAWHERERGGAAEPGSQTIRVFSLTIPAQSNNVAPRAEHTPAPGNTPHRIPMNMCTAAPRIDKTKQMSMQAIEARSEIKNNDYIYFDPSEPTDGCADRP